MLTQLDKQEANGEAKLIIDTIDDHASGGGNTLNWRRDRNALLDRLHDRSLMVDSNDKVIKMLETRKNQSPTSPDLLKQLDNNVNDLKYRNEKLHEVDSIIKTHINKRDKEMGGEYPAPETWRERRYDAGQ